MRTGSRGKEKKRGSTPHCKPPPLPQCPRPLTGCPPPKRVQACPCTHIRACTQTRTCHPKTNVGRRAHGGACCAPCYMMMRLSSSSFLCLWWPIDPPPPRSPPACSLHVRPPTWSQDNAPGSPNPNFYPIPCRAAGSAPHQFIIGE